MEDENELREINARLFSENQQLKKQVNDKQLEVDHCHAVCDELRQKLDTAVADALDAEADLILSAPQEPGRVWRAVEADMMKQVGTMMKSRAALARAKAGVK